MRYIYYKLIYKLKSFYLLLRFCNTYGIKTGHNLYFLIKNNPKEGLPILKRSIDKLRLTHPNEDYSDVDEALEGLNDLLIKGKG